MEKDLGLSGYDFNGLLSVFYIPYILLEIPSNILCKWMGPGWFLPIISLGFGVMSIVTAFVDNFAQAAGVRFVLGVFEAGMLPGISYYMSRWYRRSELSFRLALYIVMAPLAGAFGGLLASAILNLDRFGSLTSWRMIFAIEGLITTGLALIRCVRVRCATTGRRAVGGGMVRIELKSVLTFAFLSLSDSFFTLTDRPETARWLTPEERELAINRIKSERVAQSQVLDKMDTKKLVLGMWNPVTISTAIMFMFDNITVQGLAFFAPTIVKAIYPDKSTVMQQLFTVPPYAVGAFFTLLMPLIAWRLDRRQIIIIACTPLVIVGYAMFLGTSNAPVRYGATFLISSSIFALGPLTNAQVSANVVSDTARSSAIGLNGEFSLSI